MEMTFISPNAHQPDSGQYQAAGNKTHEPLHYVTDFTASHPTLNSLRSLRNDHRNLQLGRFQK